MSAIAKYEKVSRRVLLSPEFTVALEIYELTRNEGLADYATLVDSLKLHHIAIKTAIDNLSDVGMITVAWGKDDVAGVSRKAFSLSPEAERIMQKIDKFIRLGDLEAEGG